ncbi:protein JINGUBANG-like [Prosopis cineraria]|uniref:protein JINGUBANG-like n=1 Tax=Prosopis cineraria TaxID=364024 RepID=UPI00240F6B31|nr:protein JINGUBANG-like [Prosopis cineraria]
MDMNNNNSSSSSNNNLMQSMVEIRDNKNGVQSEGSERKDEEKLREALRLYMKPPLHLSHRQGLAASFMLPKNYVNVHQRKSRLWFQHCDTVSELKIWDTSDFWCMESVKAHENAINVVVQGTERCTRLSANGGSMVWKREGKAKKCRFVNSLERKKSTVNALALNGDGMMLFVEGCDSRSLLF